MRKTPVKILACGFVVAIAACSGDDTDPAAGDTEDDSGAGETEATGGPLGAGYSQCAREDFVGRFVVQLEDGFTQVEGQVLDGPDPAGSEVLDEMAGCSLVRLANNFCDPPCGASDTCSAQQTCVPKPLAVDVGAVTVAGLSAPVEMTPGPTNFYLNLDMLPHPGFSTGIDVDLSSEGGTLSPFTLHAAGIDVFSLAQAEVVVTQGQPVSLAWDAPPEGLATGVHIELDIGHHGGSPATIECDVEDTGAFEIPASLVSQLFDFGVAGFPVIEIERRTADSATVEPGCVELVVAPAAVELEVTIAGVTSCSDNTDCANGETCQGDLSCG